MNEGSDGMKVDGSFAREADVESLRRAIADPRAFGPLYELYYARVLNYAYHRTLSVCAAEEVTSNTFFKALRGLKGYRGKGPFSAWLLGIATNEVKMCWRRRGSPEAQAAWQEDLRRIYFDLHRPEADAADKLAAFAHLHGALNNLPEKYRAPLALRYFEGLSLEQVGQVLGRPAGTIKSLIHRGLEKLRRILSQDATWTDQQHLS